MLNSSKFNNLLSIAVEQAHLSTLPFKHGAILFAGSTVYSRAFNCDNRNYTNGTFFPTLHAEVNCIIKSVLNTPKARKCRKKFQLMVVRINNNGIVDSRPCDCCLHFAKKYPAIKNVVFSTENGKLKSLRLGGSTTKHYSNFYSKGFRLIWNQLEYLGEKGTLIRLVQILPEGVQRLELVNRTKIK